MFITLITILIGVTYSRAQSVPPTWITSSYFQADSKKIITTLTGNSMTPTATLLFVTPFSNIPSIGYGITSYQGTFIFISGNDFLSQ